MSPQRQAFGLLLGVGLAIGIACVEVIGAQTPTDGPRVQITVIGCVRRSEPAAPETVGTTIIPEGDTRYVRSNITLVPKNGRSGDGFTANPVAEAVNMYRLDDSANSLIAPHVGDRVQITGTIVQWPSPATGTSHQPTRPTTEATRAPMLRVNSLQKISSDSPVCSQ